MQREKQGCRERERSSDATMESESGATRRSRKDNRATTRNREDKARDAGREKRMEQLDAERGRGAGQVSDGGGTRLNAIEQHVDVFH